MKNKNDIICWWSGGITSAVACKKAIDLFGLDRCRFVFIDTFNESPDTYLFKVDCEKWYGKEIETASRIPEDYSSIQDVWYNYKSLNTANGAICSSELKRTTRKRFQKENDYNYQVFGFEFTKGEFNRALNLNLDYPKSNPIFPLLLFGLDKKACLELVINEGIEVPESYQLGYSNNNCRLTGCVQGGIGYWQKIQREELEKFNEMARVEHELTDLKGEPVTICKDQSKEAKLKPTHESLVFLKPHPDYPNNKSIDDMEGREPEPLMECNGMCDLNNLTENTNEEVTSIMMEFDYNGDK